MRRFIAYLLGTTIGYGLIILAFGSIWGSVMMIAYSRNINGDLNTVGWMFIAAWILTVFIQWNPISLAITGAIGYAYSTLPGIGSQNAREDIAKVHNFANVIWKYILVLFTLPLLVMALFHFDESINKKAMVTIIVSVAAILMWSFKSSKKSDKAIWRSFMLLGIIGFIKAFIFLKPVWMYDTFGFYPGADVYTTKIQSQKIAEELALKMRYENDVDIQSSRSAKAAKEFTNLCIALRMTSDEVMQNKESLCKMNKDTCNIIQAEEKRRENNPTNKVLKKTAAAGNAIINAITPDPDPVWVPVGEMKYSPDKPGWQKRKISVPAGQGKCRITAMTGYNQYFTDLNRTEYVPPEGRGNAKVRVEDSRFTPLAQLIKVSEVTQPKVHEFFCGTEVEASFVPNMAHNNPLNFKGNSGQVVFIVEKQFPETRT